jgi:formate dehydrogenase major subunit
MTNHWIDLKNSDCVLIMGSNAAENHPISFKWVMKAKDKGATLIHVDPRFTRTSAKCDVYAPIRSGSDIPFLGGLVKYILDNNKFFHEYVVNYTNASFVVGKDFAFDDGLFSGFDPKKGSYDKSKWAFEMDDKGVPVRDESLKNPRCVFNLLKKHFARYDVDTVSTVTGTPKEDILKVYETYAASGVPDKSATIMYAMGWTQHTVGVQNIRTMAMIQLLLGNIGVAGGGVNALRGESNVQGSTDHCLLVHILPGYLGTPKSKWSDLAAYNKNCTPQSADPMSANWWGNKPKYVSSFVKAMYPEASPEKGYEMLPKLDSHKQMTEYYWLSMFEKMHKGQFDGFFAWGQNPACGGANANKNREAMAELDWLVNVNIFDNETASFWRGPKMDPKDIKTEVFFLPCAVSIEKEGSVTNSGRWMQWRYRGPKPYGQTLPDGDIILKLTDKIQQLYKTEGGAYPDPIVGLGLNDWQNSHGHFDAHGIAKLINGYFLKDTEVKGKQFKKGQQVPSFAYLKDDGSTCSGNWLYCGSYTEKGNMAARRDKTQNGAQANIGLYPNWAWCWPVNRRILYNRASVDLNGKPYAPKKAVIEWTGDETKWQGDIPDGGWKPGTKHAFIMRKHGFGQIYGPGRADGPFPEHYEPLECPIAKNPFSSQLHNPTAYQISSEEKAVANPRFPYVGTTYRVTEHWQTGLMTRYQGWLIETEPQLFCEISEELAKKENIDNGETVYVSSLRGKLECVAIVTKRIKPYKVHGQDVHLVGLPWHYGWVTPKNGGDSANLLTPSVGDPNTGIPETKAFMVNVSKIKRA